MVLLVVCMVYNMPEVAMEMGSLVVGGIFCVKFVKIRVIN